MSSRARSPHTPWNTPQDPPQNSAVADAFLSIPLPDEPDEQSGHVGTSDSAPADYFTDSSMTCPDGLVEQVLWGILDDLTAPVLGAEGGARD